MRSQLIGFLAAASMLVTPAAANAQEVQAVVAVAAAAYKAYTEFTGQAALKRQSKTLNEISAKLSVVIAQQQEMLADLRDLKIQVASITPQSDAESLRASVPTFLSLAASRFRPSQRALDFADTTATYTGKIGQDDWTYFPAFMGGAAIVIGIHKGLHNSRASIRPYATSYEATLTRWDDDINVLIASNKAAIASNMAKMLAGVGRQDDVHSMDLQPDQRCDVEKWVDVTGSYDQGFSGSLGSASGGCFPRPGPSHASFFRLRPSKNRLIYVDLPQTYPTPQGPSGIAAVNRMIDLRNETIDLHKQLDALLELEANIAKAKFDMAKLAL